MQLKSLLLDLDGTLVHTAPDMVATLNRILRAHGLESAPLAEAENLVSNGARALLEFGFGDSIHDFKIERLIDDFLADYADHIADQSHLYAGMEDCLACCQKANIPWGVVTNKPLHLSRALLKGLGLLDDCRILLGGDSLPVKKPDPAPLLHCCMTLNLAGSECLYVGDHERDILAGNAAGMDTAVANWGYIQDRAASEHWGGTYILESPAGLHELLMEKLAYRHR